MNKIKVRITRKRLKKELENGMNKFDVARKYGCSRERIGQLCGDYGFDLRKDPRWYALHYGEPRLADIEWLKQKVQRWNGIKILSEEIGVPQNKIRAQMKRMTVSCYHANMVEVTCENCGAKKERRYCEFKRNNNHFCDRKCWLEWHEWKPEQDSFIQANYQKMTDKDMAVFLKKCSSAVLRRRLNVLKLKKEGRNRTWDVEALEFLRDNYLQLTDNEIAKILNKTKFAVTAARVRNFLKKFTQSSD